MTDKQIIDKNYKKASYTTAIELAKTPGDVFAHVIDLSKWWPEEFEGESVRSNSEFVLKTGNEHYSKNKVVEFVPNEKVTWLVTESIRKPDGFDWMGTKFIFEIIPRGNHTVLRFTYDGVILENEYDRLVQICDATVNSWFYNFITHSKG